MKPVLEMQIPTEGTTWIIYQSIEPPYYPLCFLIDTQHNIIIISVIFNLVLKKGTGTVSLIVI